MTAPATVCARSVNNTASVPAEPGASFAWSIDNGIITSGHGTFEVHFNPERQSA